MPSPAARLAVLFLVLLPALVDAKAKRLPCAPDAFADPKTDPCNPLEYIASNTLTAIAVGTFHHNNSRGCLLTSTAQ